MSQTCEKNQEAVAAFHYDKKTNKLTILDQLLLPETIEYVEVPDTESGYSVIKNMMVRGAPCIAAVGCLSIIAEMNDANFLKNLGANHGFDIMVEWLKTKTDYMNSSRPTAVNLKNATSRLCEYNRELVDGRGVDKLPDLIERLTNFCLVALESGLKANQYLGDIGASAVLSRAQVREVCVLTHCNTGSLATVGYGTALGVIRSLHKLNRLSQVYCTETRPYNQGSRLTAWELVREKIPATLIADSMVAYLMASRRIDAVLVGADRVAANGYTANKIGTLQLAVVAKHYGVPFYVAAPTQSIDLSTESQVGIEIEERPAHELKTIGGVALAPDEVNVWNPCFDVTPAELITGGIITEAGHCEACDVKKFVSHHRSSTNRDPSTVLF